MIKHLLRI